jgi:hypothetical protein
LFSKCQTNANIVLSKVDHHIYYFKTVFLPLAPDLSGLPRVNYWKNGGCAKYPLHCYEIFIEVLRQIFPCRSQYFKGLSFYHLLDIFQDGGDVWKRNILDTRLILIFLLFIIRKMMDLWLDTNSLALSKFLLNNKIS